MLSSVFGLLGPWSLLVYRAFPLQQQGDQLWARSDGRSLIGSAASSRGLVWGRHLPDASRDHSAGYHFSLLQAVLSMSPVYTSHCVPLPFRASIRTRWITTTSCVHHK